MHLTYHSQHGVKNQLYLMDHILYQILKIVLCILTKDTKILQIVLQ